MPSKRSGLFKRLKDRPYDLLVTARGFGPESPAKRLEIFHAEDGIVFTEVFDAAAKAFSSRREQVLPEALRCLMSHLRSRVLARQTCAVWFYTDAERRYMLSEAARIYAGDRKYSRALALLERGASLEDEQAPD